MNQSTFNWDVFQDTGKFNTSVKLTESDKKHNFKIYCMEPYAQDVYNKLVAFETNTKSNNTVIKQTKLPTETIELAGQTRVIRYTNLAKTRGIISLFGKKYV